MPESKGCYLWTLFALDVEYAEATAERERARIDEAKRKRESAKSEHQQRAGRSSMGRR